jgi:hypothetical protein
VEVILGTDGEGYVIHLLNLTGARHRSFGPHVAIPDGQLRLHATVEGDGVALVSDRQLEIRSEGDDMIIDLPPLEAFEVVRVRCSVPERRTTERRDLA